MAPARRRVSYVIPPPADPPPRLQLPPHGIPRNGSVGPLLLPGLHTVTPPPATPRWAQHPRHRLGVSCLALDTSTQLVGRASPEGILYTGGRDGLVISWDLGIPMKRRAQRYGVTGQSLRRWEVMTNWADDIIEEEAEEGDEYRSDGDVLGEVTGKTRRRIPQDSAIPYEEQWETDMDAYHALKSHPPQTHFRQAVQMHPDWINDILLCNYNQTLVSASSDGTIRAWSPHAHGQSTPLHEPTIIGTHTDYVRCLTYCREQQWFASGSFDRTIKLWDLASATAKTEPLITLHPPEAAGPKASIYALATDPYGSVIASGSPERVIRMWDPRSGKRIAKLVGHTDNIRAILISEDAKYLLTGSADASIKLWSLSSQRCLHTFTHHTESVWSLFSSHPALEVFYSGDRSGLVCKVDVEGCADVSEGECIVLCQDSGSDRPGTSGSEGINKIVAMDDNLVWTASGSSSIKRWQVPPRRAVRAAALSAEGTFESSVSSPLPVESAREYYMQRKRDSLDLSGSRAKSPMRSTSITREGSTSPLASKAHRVSLTPSAISATASAIADLEIDPDLEGEQTWYGIPFESLVRLTSPNDTGFGGMLAPSLRGHDPEIATLYSAASVLSVPRMVRSPVQNIFAQSGGPRSPSPMRSDTIHSRTRPEENMTIQPTPRSRAAYDVREVAADAIPLRLDPDEVIDGDHGLVRCVMLNDRVHALTVDTAGEVAVWDVVRGACLGWFTSEEVAAASFCGSDQSLSGAGGSADGRSVTEKHRSPREALETVRERIEGEAVVTSWSSLDTKTGVLTVHLNEKCFEAEIYADEAGYGPERQFSEEARLNIGKWVLRNLFYGFIREEQRQAARRARDRDHNGHDSSSQHRLQRGGAPTHIDINASSSTPNARSRSSSDVSARSATSQGPRSATIILSPNMLPAVSPSISSHPRSSPLMTPMIPLHGGLRDSALSPIPQSPSTAEATPLPRGSKDVHKAETLSGPPSSFPPSGTSTSDYFSLRTRRPSVSTAPTPDDFSGWGGKSAAISTSAPETPSTPSVGSLMGRLKAFGKGTRRAASETPGPTTPGGTITAPPVGAIPDEPASQPVAKTPAQVLLSGPVNPPSSSEAPSLPIPPTTSILISEEAPSGWHTLYRGNVSSTASDIRQLEENMPMWLLECLLLNKVPPIPITKISFVLLPYKEPDGETLPELLNTQQSKLTASRFLRVRKLTMHVQDKLERIAGGSHSPVSAVATPRSSFDRRSLSSARGHDRPRADEQYEILCNDMVLPLDMTLAAVRQYVWRRQSTELVMHYRRKVHTSPPPPLVPAPHPQ
ncbi:WD40 repeat-like protein [Lentinus tigrinus ALCF2SS1-7]|uniref:WD40 repeat-like protein n=1 Tax=Lentinus tigrinus ALCF2SS1-7 TaxID=1328758 RepID=UPI0011660CC2|nr:WD40 repeat-like protein [Lentinus tigrinus ALCF2SS1-7]